LGDRQRGACRGPLTGAWYASVSDANYRQLGRRYQARYGRAPYRLASLGYDAALLTVRVANDWKVGTPFPSGALADQGGFGGVDGAFRFARDGIAERTLEVNQVARVARPWCRRRPNRSSRA
jgi:hypothetical protein